MPLLLLAACAADLGPQHRVEELKRNLAPGLGLARVREILDQQGVTYSIRTGSDCAALANESRLPTHIAPRGGPCVFGKVPGKRNWLGAHSDVIMQLVFSANGYLADGHFEVVDAYF